MVDYDNENYDSEVIKTNESGILYRINNIITINEKDTTYDITYNIETETFIYYLFIYIYSKINY